MSKIQVNSQGKVYITGNGKILLGNEGSGNVKYGCTIDNLLGDIDTDGILQLPVYEYNLIFNNVKNIADQGLIQKFRYTKVKTISFPDLTEMSGLAACSASFSYCDLLTSVDLSSLIEVSGSGSCSEMFSYTTSLAYVDVSNLVTISGATGCNRMFYGSSIKTIYFTKLENITGNAALQQAFAVCSEIENIYFPALKITSFGSYNNQFNNLLFFTGTTVTHTLHFPSNLESTIQSLASYPLFGGTSGYVVLAFDLPATS